MSTTRGIWNVHFINFHHTPLPEGGPVCIFRSGEFLCILFQYNPRGVKITWVDILTNGDNFFYPLFTFAVNKMRLWDERDVMKVSKSVINGTFTNHFTIHLWRNATDET